MDIVEYAAADPVSVLTDEDKYSKFLAFVKSEIAKYDLSIETDAGRQQIKSLAYKVTRTKTTIDEAGKKLNEEARAQINAVDAKRRKIREELDGLAKDVRRPLTEWEEAEKAREQQVARTFERLRELAAVQAEEASDAIAGRISQVDAIDISEDVFRSRAAEAERLKEKTRNDLQALFERTKQHEADQAELARLRAEQEERERQEREARERKEAEQAEQKRQEHAAAEAKRLAEEAAERARQEERDRQEREERKRREAEEAQRREDEKRAANKRHRTAVMKEVTATLMGLGADEAAAKAIVQAIADGYVPHTSIRF